MNKPSELCRADSSTAVCPGGGKYESFAAQLLHISKTMSSDDIFKPRNVLFFPAGLPFLPDNKHNALWIHKSYSRIAAEITNTQLGKVSSHHLIGASGTGKSTFGVLWLVSLALKNSKVLYRSQDKAWILYDFSTTTFTTRTFTSYTKAQRYVDSSVWLIVDGRSKPVLHPGPVLQCVSGPPHAYVEFAEALGGRLIYMNPWDQEDCHHCFTDLHLQLDSLPLRYFYAGGIPRYILNDAAYRLGELKYSVHAAGLSIGDWGNLFTDSWNLHVSEKLVHFRYSRVLLDLKEQPAGYMTLRQCVPASEYARMVIVNGLMDQSSTARGEFISRLRGVREAAGLREAAFERVVHEELSKGGEFTMRRMGDRTRGGEFKKSLRPQGAVSKYYDCKTGESYVYAEVFTSREQIHLKDKLPLQLLGWEQYVKQVTETETEGAVDSFMTPGRSGSGMIFRVTVSVQEEPAIKWTYVEQVIEFLDGWCQKQGRAPPPKYWFAFVVPEEEVFSVDKTFKSIEFAQPTKSCMERLEYYVLGVKVC